MTNLGFVVVVTSSQAGRGHPGELSSPDLIHHYQPWEHVDLTPSSDNASDFRTQLPGREGGRVETHFLSPQWGPRPPHIPSLHIYPPEGVIYWICTALHPPPLGSEAAQRAQPQWYGWSGWRAWAGPQLSMTGVGGEHFFNSRAQK